MNKHNNFISAIIITALCLSVYIFVTFGPLVKTIFFAATFVISAMLAYYCKNSFVIIGVVLAYLCAAFSNQKNPFSDYGILYKYFIILMFLVLPGICSGVCIKKKFDFRSTVIFSTLTIILVLIAELLKIKFFDNIPIGKEFISKPIDNLFNAFKISYSSAGIDNTGEISTFLSDDFLKAVKQSFMMLSPAIIISLFFSGCVILLLASKKVITAFLGENFEFFYPVSHFIMNRSSALFVTLTFIISVFLPDNIISVVVTNIMLIFLSAFFWCGMSFYDFYLRKIVKFWVFRVLIYLFIFGILMFPGAVIPLFNPIFLTVVIAVIDSGRDFRKIRKPIFKIFIG